MYFHLKDCKGLIYERDLRILLKRLVYRREDFFRESNRFSDKISYYNLEYNQITWFTNLEHLTSEVRDDFKMDTHNFPLFKQKENMKKKFLDTQVLKY